MVAKKLKDLLHALIVLGNVLGEHGAIAAHYARDEQEWDNGYDLEVNGYYLARVAGELIDWLELLERGPVAEAEEAPEEAAYVP